MSWLKLESVISRFVCSPQWVERHQCPVQVHRRGRQGRVQSRNVGPRCCCCSAPEHYATALLGLALREGDGIPAAVAKRGQMSLVG